jgi:hypothetical protein
LIDHFVAPLITLALPLVAVCNSLRLILGQIFPGSSGSTCVASRTVGGDGGAADGSPRRNRSTATLQKIGRRAAASCRTRSACGAGRGTRSVEEIIYLTRGWTAAGSNVARCSASA